MVRSQSWFVSFLAASAVLAATSSALAFQSPPSAAPPAASSGGRAEKEAPNQMVVPPANAQPPVPPVQPVEIGKGVEAPQPTVVLKPGEVPAIEFDTRQYDFGRVRSGTDVVHDFWFTNKGTGPLEITSVRPSCGCTTASQFDKIVQPGKTGKIPIKVSTTNFSGKVTKAVTVTTNVPGNDTTIMLQISGELWQPLQVTPPSAAFGRVSTESSDANSIVRKLTVVNNMDKPAKLSNVTSSHPLFKGEASELEKGKKFELTITLVAPFTPGMANATLSMSTDMMEMPTLTVPVSAFILPDVEVTPNQIALPSNRVATLQRQLYVRSNTSKPLTLSDLTSSNPDLKFDMRESTPGSAYLITMNIPESYKVSPGDNITFKTSSPAMPLVSVPIVEIRTSPPPMAGPVAPPAAAAMTPAATAVQATASPAAQPPPAAPGSGAHDHSGHDHSSHPH